MSRAILNRVTVLTSTVILNSWLKCSGVSLSKACLFHGRDKAYSVANRLHLSPLFPENKGNADWLKDCKVQVMDDEAWRVSSGLLDVCRGNGSSINPNSKEQVDFDDDFKSEAGPIIRNEVNPDFDEIEDMRIRRNLFYKIDKDSKEYEEYTFDFRRRRNGKNEKTGKQSKDKKKENPTCKSVSQVEKVSDDQRETKKVKDCKVAAPLGRAKHVNSMLGLHTVGDLCIEKKQRTLTFNQQTAAYHEPFCLDIYISKGSVRASIIHRATSNVVAVSHSISKDMKFDLSSTKNRNACAAVGEVLAQKALADDIHNVVYTPRKGEKLEGKLQIVLNSVIKGGINVKVKLKQKTVRKARQHLMGT